MENHVITSQYFWVDAGLGHAARLCCPEPWSDFTKGVILNRPTAYSTLDLETSLKFDNFSHEGVDDWNVWCGGDCQGINSRGRIPPEPGAELGTGRMDDDIYI